MSNDPEASRDQTRREPIEGPEHKTSKAIEEGCRKRNMCRSEQRLDVRGGLVDDTDEEKVPDTVTRSDAVMCTGRWSAYT
jgi:hypothetical protein